MPLGQLRSTPRVPNFSADSNDSGRGGGGACKILECKQTESCSLLSFVYFPMKRNGIQLTRDVNTKEKLCVLRTSAHDCSRLPEAVTEFGLNFLFKGK
jgi:hypothetical protein